MAGVGVGQCTGQGELQRGFGQVGHGAGDVVQRGGLLDVQYRQAFQHQVARHAQRGGQVATPGLQLADQRRDVAHARYTGRQAGQLAAIAATHALDKTAVGGERR